MAKGFKSSFFVPAAAVAIGLALYVGLDLYQRRPTPQSSGTGPRGEQVTLDPRLFQGPVRQAYQAAEQKPALLAQLFCYCGCNREFGHRSLLECYRDSHGSRCAVCIGEALEAVKLEAQGTPVDQIRDVLRKRYAK